MNPSIKNVNINELDVAESVISKYPESIIFGDYARALKKDIFLAGDKLVFITHDADMVIDACVRLRTKVGMFRKTRDKPKIDNSIRATIVCAAIEDTPEFDDQVEQNYGYLSKDEWVALNPTVSFKNTLQYSTEVCVPEMAKVVWHINCADMNGFEYNLIVHVVLPNIDLENYAIALASKMDEATANLVYIKNDHLCGAHPTSLEDVTNNIIRFSGKVSRRPVRLNELVNIGWKQVAK